MSTTQPGSRADALDAIASRVSHAVKESLVAGALIHRPSRRPEDLDLAEQKILAAGESGKHALALLQQQGAVLHSMPPATDVPLQLLDTPANRRLLAALETAVACAEEVDRERGRSGDKLHADDTNGTDLAEYVNQIRCRVATEVHGMPGRE